MREDEALWVPLVLLAVMLVTLAVASRCFRPDPAVAASAALTIFDPPASKQPYVQNATFRISHSQVSTVERAAEDSPRSDALQLLTVTGPQTLREPSVVDKHRYAAIALAVYRSTTFLWLLSVQATPMCAIKT